MNSEETKALIEKYLAGTCSPEEKELVEHAYNRYHKPYGNITEAELREMKNEVWNTFKLDAAPKTAKLWPRVAGIAAAVIGIAVCVWFYANEVASSRKAPRNDEWVKSDIAPGGNNATLTIGDGSPMQLSSAHNGVVIDDDIKYNDGTVLSPSKGEMPEGQRGIPNITATTPRGGMYQFTLPDNTKIWLNNASNLNVSPKFWNATQRVVQLTGQAYFEVAKDAKRPFIVQSAGQNITVLGTHFDISAYPGEAIKTTLLEGSVRVSSLRGGTTKQPPLHNEQDGEAVTLKPNQQSIVTTNNKIEVKQVDVNEIIAWKNGYFRFYDVDLESFMTTIARWYNIEVNYEGGINQYKDLAFGGAVSRSKNISEVMKILEQTGKVHYKIEGRKVTITK